MRVLGVICLLAGLIVLGIAIAGCGEDGQAAQATAAPAWAVSPKTFTSAKFLWSVTYDRSQVRPQSDKFDSSSEFITVDFVGRKPSKKFVQRSGLRVFAQKMYSPRQAILSKAETMDRMSVEMRWVKVTGYEPATLNGLQGTRTTFTWDGGHGVRYTLHKGLYFYELTQELRDDEQQTLGAALDDALNSFTVKAE